MSEPSASVLVELLRTLILCPVASPLASRWPYLAWLDAQVHLSWLLTCVSVECDSAIHAPQNTLCVGVLGVAFIRGRGLPCASKSQASLHPFRVLPAVLRSSWPRKTLTVLDWSSRPVGKEPLHHCFLLYRSRSSWECATSAVFVRQLVWNAVSIPEHGGVSSATTLNQLHRSITSTPIWVPVPCGLRLDPYRRA